MTKSILHYLRVQKRRPCLAYLQELISAFSITVPWESISKILRKATWGNPENCFRSENEFWTQSFQYGTGGTCYESNWAFSQLLISLGFDAYLTINKIVDKNSAHTAIVVTIDQLKYLVDVGYPLYAPIQLDADRIRNTSCHLITYRSSCLGQNEYLIENFPHPRPYLFHLKDVPVNPVDYLETARDDYGENGLFSDRIIIRKVIDQVPARFDSSDIPFNIHTLHNGEKQRTVVNEDQLIKKLSDHFKISPELVARAFTLLPKTTAKPHREFVP
jgi:arylamine N-acetyltransferase